MSTKSYNSGYFCSKAEELKSHCAICIKKSNCNDVDQVECPMVKKFEKECSASISEEKNTANIAEKNEDKTDNSMPRANSLQGNFNLSLIHI